jgi:Mn2+/Fe2+ NRAMP family transporter
MNERLEALRRRIEHEDELISQRLSWLVGSQSFLLTAFAISLNAGTVAKEPAYAAANRMLVALLPPTGIACVLIVGFTVAGAIWSLSELRALAGQIAGPGDLPIHSRPAIRRLGLAAPVAIPCVFLTLWLALILSR